MHKDKKHNLSTTLISSANIFIKESFINLDFFSVRNKPETIIMNNLENNDFK